VCQQEKKKRQMVMWCWTAERHHELCDGLEWFGACRQKRRDANEMNEAHKVDMQEGLFGNGLAHANNNNDNGVGVASLAMVSQELQSGVVGVGNVQCAGFAAKSGCEETCTFNIH
jgi:hypothetical protein